MQPAGGPRTPEVRTSFRTCHCSHPLPECHGPYSPRFSAEHACGACWGQVARQPKTWRLIDTHRGLDKLLSILSGSGSHGHAAPLADWGRTASSGCRQLRAHKSAGGLRLSCHCNQLFWWLRLAKKMKPKVLAADPSPLIVEISTVGPCWAMRAGITLAGADIGVLAVGCNQLGRLLLGFALGCHSEMTPENWCSRPLSPEYPFTFALQPSVPLYI